MITKHSELKDGGNNENTEMGRWTHPRKKGEGAGKYTEWMIDGLIDKFAGG